MIKTSIDGHVRIDDLVFSLTRQCNALCDHCCNDDSPKKKGVIDITNAEQWIRDFVLYVPYCRTAGFTGGEVFLRYKEMYALHEMLAPYNFVTSITTNGFWGNNPERSRKQLQELMRLGLREMAISIDPSHTPWIKTEHSTQAVKIAIECGLVVAVSSHFLTDGGSGKDYFEPEWHDRIIWDESHYVLPVGRGTNLVRFVKNIVPTHLFCPEVQMVIQPNGDVDPCCSVCLDDGVFVVGNLYRQSMPEVLTEMLSDVYLKVITHRGMNELENIVQRFFPEYSLPPRMHSVCYMCNALRQADNFWMVKVAMQEYGKEILLANLAMS